jgi:hypothetical protein
MLPPQRQVRLALGKTGSGKSTLAREFIKQQTRVIILDPAGFNEYDVHECESFVDLKTYLIANHNDGRGFFRVSYSPRYSEEIPAVFELARAVNYSEKTNSYVNQSWLVLEEADLLPGPEEVPEYNEAISRGRHYGMNIYAVSLYPYKLPPMLRRQATNISAFSTHEPNDVKWYREVFGDRGDEVTELQPHYFLEWERGEVSGPKSLQIV